MRSPQPLGHRPVAVHGLLGTAQQEVSGKQAKLHAYITTRALPPVSPPTPWKNCLP